MAAGVALLFTIRKYSPIRVGVTFQLEPNGLLRPPVFTEKFGISFPKTTRGDGRSVHSSNASTPLTRRFFEYSKSSTENSGT